MKYGARGGKFDRDNAIQVVRLQARFPMMSLEFRPH